jgi:cellulase
VRGAVRRSTFSRLLPLALPFAHPSPDIIESNTAAAQITPHRCDPPVNGYYDSCDKGGCGINSGAQPGAFGAGASFTIDTTYPFNLSTSFAVDPATGLLQVWEEGQQRQQRGGGMCMR